MQELKDYYIKQYIDLAKAIISNFRPFLISKIKHLTDVLHVSSVITFRQ